MIDKKAKKMLAELAIIGVGQHQYQHAENIATALLSDNEYFEIVATIRALSFMNRNEYEAAIALLEPFSDQYPEFVCFIILSAEKLCLSTKLEYWLEKGKQSPSKKIRDFVDTYMESSK